MNINILRFSLFGIAGSQEEDRNFYLIYYLPTYNDCIINFGGLLTCNFVILWKLLIKFYTATQCIVVKKW